MSCDYYRKFLDWFDGIEGAPMLRFETRIEDGGGGLSDGGCAAIGGGWRFAFGNASGLQSLLTFSCASEKVAFWVAKYRLRFRS